MEPKKKSYASIVLLSLLFISFLITAMYFNKKLNDAQAQVDNAEENIENIYKEIFTYDDEFFEIRNNIDYLNDLYKSNRNFFYDYDVHDDMRKLYYGRLYVPDLNISVALYHGTAQWITDRDDSANIFGINEYPEDVIADHSNQEFSKLFSVKVGTKGYIRNKYMKLIDIECVNIFSGYNEGYSFVDANGNIALGKADYMMYTCSDHGSILITLWNVIE